MRRKWQALNLIEQGTEKVRELEFDTYLQSKTTNNFWVHNIQILVENKKFKLIKIAWIHSIETF